MNGSLGLFSPSAVYLCTEGGKAEAAEDDGRLRDQVRECCIADRPQRDRRDCGADAENLSTMALRKTATY
jgi:hypothetical protein